MRVWIFCILSAWILGACNSNRKFSGSLLKATLQQADGNTGELIAVLEHYEDDPQIGMEIVLSYQIGDSYDYVTDTFLLSGYSPRKDARPVSYYALFE